MKRALAFCRTIKKSEIIEDEFTQVVEEYTRSELVNNAAQLQTEIRRIDGSCNASTREGMLN